jgi:hypothetical protein
MVTARPSVVAWLPGLSKVEAKIGGAQEVTTLTKRNLLPEWMLINGQSARLHDPADSQGHRFGRAHVVTPVQSDSDCRSAAESAGGNPGRILSQRYG